MDAATVSCDSNSRPIDPSPGSLAFALRRRSNCLGESHNDARRLRYKRPRILLLADSWGGHSNQEITAGLRNLGVKVLTIPKQTTAKLQPLDVSFNRQYKKFVKKLTEKAAHEGKINDVTSRNGTINLHSLIWNQFAAPIYSDLLRSGWHNTDPDYSTDELVLGNPPPTVDEIQFSVDAGIDRCEVDESLPAYLRCAHCGCLLSLDGFLDRSCSHDTDTTDELDLDEFYEDEDTDEYDFYLTDSYSATPYSTSSTVSPPAIASR